MLEKIKNRRMKIQEQFKDHTRKISSVQKRKKIEQNLDRFMETMNKIDSNSQLVLLPCQLNHGMNEYNDNKNVLQDKNEYSHRELDNIEKKEENLQEKDINLQQQFYENEVILEGSELKNIKQYLAEQLPTIKEQGMSLPQQKKEENINLSNQKMMQSHEFNNKLQLQKIDQEEIKLSNNILKQFQNDSNPSNTISDNNSSAILFTSQFKQYIKNRQNIGGNEREELSSVNALNKNLSDKSLVLSNDSSLKFSLEPSSVPYIINKKLQNQRYIDSDDFFSPLSKMLRLVEKYQLHLWVKGIKILVKFKKLQSKIHFNTMKYYFDSFLMYPEILFQEKKNIIKVNHYIQKLNQKRIRQIFYKWKYQCYTKIIKSKQYAIIKQNKLIDSIFRTFKMMWYDKKVINQVQMYYISKIFTKWKEVAKTNAYHDQNKALRQYYRSARKRFFQLFKNGIQNTRRQKESQEIAYQYYRILCFRKYLTAWKQACPYKQKMISLSMTMKNTFKLTSSSNWQKTCTIRFK